MIRAAFLLLVSLLISAATMSGQHSLILPTENTTLLNGGGPDFYMYVDREFKGVKSKPWQAGQYGYVRNPMDTAAGRIYTRFHEGIDIKPLRRDAAGVPLDPIVAVDDGKVVYVNELAGRSNYGKYIVVEHIWNGTPFYSLYAHLRTTDVQAGYTVKQGDTLGILGWTGSGLNQERAHVHFEINLMLNSRFDDLYNIDSPPSPNHHGKFSGLNLLGIDVAKFYLARKNNPSLGITEFLSSEPVFFRVLLPAGPGIELLKRYPWMAGEHASARPASWEIHFTDTGVPVKAVPSDIAVSAPRLSGIRNSKVPYLYATRRLVTGTQGSARLTESGLRAMRLLTFPN